MNFTTHAIVTASFTNFQHSSFPRTLYNNTTPKRSNPPSLYYQLPSQNITHSATHAVPSPSTGRKHKNKKSGRCGAGRKRQRQPHLQWPLLASAICVVGPPAAVSTDPKPGNDPPTSSPQALTVTMQQIVNSESLPAPSATTQLPSTLYPSLQTNRGEVCSCYGCLVFLPKFRFRVEVNGSPDQHPRSPARHL